MVPGAPSTDAPIAADGQAGWFPSHLGNQFCSVYFSDGTPLSDDAVSALRALAIKPLVVVPSGARITIPANIESSTRS